MLSLAVLGAAALSSCSKVSAWSTEYDTAAATARKLNKTVMVLFSGDDWDGISSQYKKDVFEKKEFLSAYKDTNVFVNIDFSQEEYGKSIVDEGASEKEKAEADKIAEAFKKKEAFAATYNLQQYPSLYILSKEGYVLQVIPYSENVNTLESVNAEISNGAEKRTALLNLIQTLNDAEGNIDKAYAVDALFEATEDSYRAPLAELFVKIKDYDKENSTGLLGKYEVQEAYLNAGDYMKNGNIEGAVALFMQLAETGHLDAEQKQEVYYTASFILANTGSDDYDRMISLLEKSYEFAPNSLHGNDITDTIKEVKRMQEYASLEPGMELESKD